MRELVIEKIMELLFENDYRVQKLDLMEDEDLLALYVEAVNSPQKFVR